VLLGAGLLLLAPHLAVTREDHCGIFISMHMMDKDWTAIFAAAAFAGIAAMLVNCLAFAAIVGCAAGGFGIYLLLEIRSWYSYEPVPANPDLMARIFGHVMDVGLPLALLGCVLFVLAAVLPDNAGAKNAVSVVHN